MYCDACVRSDSEPATAGRDFGSDIYTIWYVLAEEDGKRVFQCASSPRDPYRACAGGVAYKHVLRSMGTNNPLP